jgi:hypothetical protein
MPSETKQATDQAPTKLSDDRWAELMAKLDEVTEILRKACEGQTPPAQETGGAQPPAAPAS